LLPSDYAGPPASAVSGNVIAGLDVAKDAGRPRLSLEWLSDPQVMASGNAGNGLIGQPLSFQRSPKLQNDWEIGLHLPAEGAKWTDLSYGLTKARLGVGKIVYFDDRMADERLDWDCNGDGCDVVKSVSAEFVVFVETPPTCQSVTGGQRRTRVSRGYHYYRLTGGSIRELDSRDSLSFVVTNLTLPESDPTTVLRDFAAVLLYSWSGGPLGSCL
jgi:hypothetical protein